MSSQNDLISIHRAVLQGISIRGAECDIDVSGIINLREADLGTIETRWGTIANHNGISGASLNGVGASKGVVSFTLASVS